jgi:small subunit ribosomal protein S21
MNDGSQNNGAVDRNGTGAASSAGNNTGGSSSGSGRYEGRPRRSDGYSSEGGGDSPRFRDSRFSGPGSFEDRARAGAMEVVVSHNIEKAMKILKRKLIKEGLFKELKARRYFEKPSEKRKRKEKEARKKARKDEARLRKGPGVI